MIHVWPVRPSLRCALRTCHLFVGLCALLAATEGPAVRGEGPPPAERLAGVSFILNQDSRDLCYMAPTGNVQPWMRDWYRRAFSAGVDVFIAEVVHPDLAVVKDLPTAEILGAPDQAPHEAAAAKRYLAVKELMDQGTDLLHIVCEEGDRSQAIVLGGMRMSDAHHGARWQPPTAGGHGSKFISTHPEWCNTWEDGSLDATLNYAVPEVRAHRLQILREMATNYDIDGIELDWTRHGRHFPAGRQKQFLNVLTDYVHEIRGMLDEVARHKGRPRLILGHRVTTTIEECLSVGCDVQTWIKNGDADFLAVMDFLHYDPNMPVEEFAHAAEGTACRVFAGFGSARYSLGESYQPRDGSRRRTAMLNTYEQFRAAAANWHAWGTHGATSYNMLGWSPDKQNYYCDVIAILANREKAPTGARHYVYLPTWKDHLTMSDRMKRFASPISDWTVPREPGQPVRLSMGYMQAPGASDAGHGTSPTGKFAAQSLVFAPSNIGVRQTFDFRMADGRQGEPLSGWLRFRVYEGTPQDRFRIDLNGFAIPADKWQIDHLPDGESAGRTNREMAFPDDGTIDFPANLRLRVNLADCPRFRGDNQLGITLLEKNPQGAARLMMESLEVYVE